MNHPVGNRYDDKLMPLGPNSLSDGSLSDGSMEESEIVSVTGCSFCVIPAPANWRTDALTLRRAFEDFVYFYYFKH
jgi:hypothetical protein